MSVKGSDLQSAPVYSERDLVVISALASGMTHAEIGKLLDISPKGVENWIRAHKARIKPAAAIITNIIRSNKARIRSEALDDFMGEIKKLDSLSLQTLKDAMNSTNEQLRYTAGREQRDRRMGAPKSSVKVEGKVDHTHQHTMEIPAELVALMQRDIVTDRLLEERRLQITGEVIDAGGQ